MYDEGMKWTPPNARSLPPHFIPPLRQASAILARQSQHVTLVVLRRDYQIMPQEKVSKSPLSILERLTRPRSTTKPRDAGTYGIRLMHLTGLQPIESERLWKKTKTSGWLCLPKRPRAYGLPNDDMYSSIAQYDTLFSSEGLTLLALDGMYSVKAALASYSRTRSPLRMEDAVDELHRLSDRGKDKVARDDLLEAYGRLGVPSSAVDDLDRNYKREYGVSVMSMPGTGYTSSTCQGRSRSGPLPAEGQDGGSKTATRHSEPIVVGACTPAKPALKLRTSFGNSPDSTARAAGGEDDEPPDSVALAIQPSYPFSIDDILSADALTPAPALATPGGHDTLSPTTRGEWRILMVDDAFKSGKTAPVEAW